MFQLVDVALLFLCSLVSSFFRLLPAINILAMWKLSSFVCWILDISSARYFLRRSFLLIKEYFNSSFLFVFCLTACILPCFPLLVEIYLLFFVPWFLYDFIYI
jgi:hypothetical protein